MTPVDIMFPSSRIQDSVTVTSACAPEGGGRRRGSEGERELVLVSHWHGAPSIMHIGKSRSFLAGLGCAEENRDADRYLLELVHGAVISASS